MLNWMERSRMPVEQVLAVAKQKMAYIAYRQKVTLPDKPRVRVFQHKSGKVTLVLRLGGKIATAGRWDTLLKKAAWGPWSNFSARQIRARWH